MTAAPAVMTRTAEHARDTAAGAQQAGGEVAQSPVRAAARKLVSEALTGRPAPAPADQEPADEARTGVRARVGAAFRLVVNGAGSDQEE